VHDSFRDALVVEVRELLAEVEVLHQGRAALAHLERVVGVVDRNSLVRGEYGLTGIDPIGVELTLLVIRRCHVSPPDRIRPGPGAVAQNASIGPSFLE
jgi:hypothetical protein